MQAIPNRIVIGDEESPILTITNENIESVSEESAVSLIGDELFIDQFVPLVKYQVFIKYLFVPLDHDRFVTADGQVLFGYYNYDLRQLPYGTKITFYTDNRVSGVFYSENVERTGKAMYKINAISAIGLMNRQISKGGIYTGQPFESVLREIIGDEYEYTINEDVAALRVYGWLPYSTRRRNLHQLIMAYGVNIVRSDIGGMLFTFLGNTTPQEIPANRIYQGGKVTYNDPASRVEVVEHAYHYLASTAEETLFDNTGSDAVSNALITFDKPIYADSLMASSGNLTISSKGVNYAVVSGIGVLVGKPYVHTTKVVSADNSDAAKEKVVRVEDATLVTLTNSENVLLRVAEYYFNATTVENSIVVDTEKCGRRFAMLNAFEEPVNGFLAKMSTAVSSIRKATCEFIADYTPLGLGSSYTNIVILPEASGTWAVPQEVKDKAVPNIRVVLIGGGESGTAGTKGENGTPITVITHDSTTETANGRPGKGGAGGLGGLGGSGGKIYATTIDCTGINSFSYGRSGQNTFLRGGGHSLNTVNGVVSETGFLEIFSGTVYALPGHAGQDGAAGGDGGWYKPSKYGASTYPTAGGDVTHNGKTYKGGTPGGFSCTYYSSVNDAYNGGGGSGGAAVGANGGNGSATAGGKGANGAKGEAPAVAMYGCGGNGGNGGGGGGGTPIVSIYNWQYGHMWGVIDGSAGVGGAGGEGSEGNPGCVIIYY